MRFGIIRIERDRSLERRRPLRQPGLEGAGRCPSLHGLAQNPIDGEHAFEGGRRIVELALGLQDKAEVIARGQENPAGPPWPGGMMTPHRPAAPRA